MGELPSEGLAFKVSALGSPVSGACVRLRLIIRLKNDVSMGLGPTDEQGSVVASLEDLQAVLHREASFFPMDYRPDTWTRKVEARVMTSVDIERFESASNPWRDSPDLYAPGEVEAIHGWAERMRLYAGKNITIDGEILGSEIQQLDLRPATWIEENRR